MESNIPYAQRLLHRAHVRRGGAHKGDIGQRKVDWTVKVQVQQPRMRGVNEAVGAVERAIRDSNLGLNPATEGQVLRIRIPELNEQRRKELVKVANKYAEDARIAVRHVRRDGIDIIKKALKDKSISEDDEKRFETDVQKVTDKAVAEIDQTLGLKEKEIMQV